MDTHKILMVVTNADLAGAPIHVRDLAIGLHTFGMHIGVVFGEDGPVKTQLDEFGLCTFVVPTLRSSISPLSDVKSFFSIKKIATVFRPDIIHAHSSKAGLVARAVALSIKVPTVYTVHGWGFGRGRRKLISLFCYFTEFFFSPLTDKFITVSDSDRQIGLKYLPISNSKIITVYNSTGFQPVQMKLKSELASIVMVARNHYPKDYVTFFKALSSCNVDLIRVVGSGTDDPEFIQSAMSLSGISFPRIEFLGPRSDIEEILETSSIFVLCSYFEGLPISIIEAMSKALPIIASDVGGVHELVEHGKNGYLFKAGDFNSLAVFLNTLLHNPEIRNSFGINSLVKFNAKFNVSTQIRNTVSVYDSTLSFPCK